MHKPSCVFHTKLRPVVAVGKSTGVSWFMRVQAVGNSLQGHLSAFPVQCSRTAMGRGGVCSSQSREGPHPHCLDWHSGPFEAASSCFHQAVPAGRHHCSHAHWYVPPHSQHAVRLAVLVLICPCKNQALTAMHCVAAACASCGGLNVLVFQCWSPSICYVTARTQKTV